MDRSLAAASEKIDENLFGLGDDGDIRDEITTYIRALASVSFFAWIRLPLTGRRTWSISVGGPATALLLDGPSFAVVTCICYFSSHTLCIHVLLLSFRPVFTGRSTYYHYP